MRLLIQRVTEAKVSIAGEMISQIGPGLCIFLGIAKEDTRGEADYLAGKVAELRIFEDALGKMNCSLAERNGEVLVVSEFTLYADCTKGRRPSFSQAASPGDAEALYGYFVEKLRQMGLRVATGRFQAKMEVGMVNEGPVTFILDSR